MKNFIIEANEIALRESRSHLDNMTKLLSLHYIDNVNRYSDTSKLYMANLKHLLSNIITG